MKTGFYFRLGKKEVFVVTNRKNVTEKLLSTILRKLLLPDNPDIRRELRYYIVPANLEIKHCPANAEMNVKEHDYYNIWGKNFSGYGSEDVNDGNTIIVELD